VSTKPPAQKPLEISKNARFAVIAARFNEAIVEELLRGCMARLIELGVAESRIAVHRVPGAFELPLAAKWAAKTGKFAAVICLGAVIRGDTPHFDYVAGESARGIASVGIETGVPVIFGVLTTDNEEQARERSGGKHGHAGRRAAEAAVEMAVLKRKIG
jgi:6,7-dimethyl-8-ribityllumazine synthase